MAVPDQSRIAGSDRTGLAKLDWTGLGLTGSNWTWLDQIALDLAVRIRLDLAVPDQSGIAGSDRTGLAKLDRTGLGLTGSNWTWLDQIVLDFAVPDRTGLA